MTRTDYQVAIVEIAPGKFELACPADVTPIRGEPADWDPCGDMQTHTGKYASLPHAVVRCSGGYGSFDQFQASITLIVFEMTHKKEKPTLETIKGVLEKYCTVELRNAQHNPSRQDSIDNIPTNSLQERLMREYHSRRR